MSEAKTVLMVLASSSAMANTIEEKAAVLREAIPPATITQLPVDIWGFSPGAFTWVAATYTAPAGEGSDLARDLSAAAMDETAWGQWDPESREFHFATYCEGEERQSDGSSWDLGETEDEFHDYCRTFGDEATVLVNLLFG